MTPWLEASTEILYLEFGNRGPTLLLNLAVVIKSPLLQCQLEFKKKKNSHKAIHLDSIEGVTEHSRCLSPQT
jgi:hypothetical protein